ncbi:MAG: hypothetical protein R3E96_11605 [Planctomycetota bacterium]
MSKTDLWRPFLDRMRAADKQRMIDAWCSEAVQGAIRATSRRPSAADPGGSLRQRDIGSFAGFDGDVEGAFEEIGTARYLKVGSRYLDVGICYLEVAAIEPRGEIIGVPVGMFG